MWAACCHVISPDPIRIRPREVFGSFLFFTFLYLFISFDYMTKFIVITSIGIRKNKKQTNKISKILFCLT